MKPIRVDLYTSPHKDLRRMLFEASNIAAETDYSNTTDLAKLSNFIKGVLYKVRAHARCENTYAHPILAPKIPANRQFLEAEHEEHHEELDNLELLLKTIESSAPDDERRSALGVEFYRALNRHIAANLQHMNEEEYLMQNIWELCSPSELFAIMVAFIANEEPEGFSGMMSMVDANLDAAQKAEMFEVIRSRLGEDIFRNVDMFVSMS